MGCVLDSQDLAHSRCSVSGCQMAERESEEEAAQGGRVCVKGRALESVQILPLPLAAGPVPASLCFRILFVKWG